VDLRLKRMDRHHRHVRHHRLLRFRRRLQHRSSGPDLASDLHQPGPQARRGLAQQIDHLFGGHRRVGLGLEHVRCVRQRHRRVRELRSAHGGERAAKLGDRLGAQHEAPSRSAHQRAKQLVDDRRSHR